MFYSVLNKILLVLLLTSAADARPLPLNRFEVSRQSQTDPNGYFKPLFTLGEDFANGRVSDERIRNDMRLAKQVGVRHLRCGFSWEEIEYEKYHFDFENWDRIVQIALEEGITLIPYVSYTPYWAVTQDKDHPTAYPPNDLKDFGRFMYQIAKRYRAYINVWELWNEPDVETWKGTVAQFAEMIKFAAIETRRANPQAIIVLGGMTQGPYEFIQGLVTIHGINEYVDIAAFHAYPESWHNPRTARRRYSRWLSPKSLTFG